MFGSQALEVVFGLIFVYLVLSLLCSAVNETLASVLAWRAKVLREDIANFLGGEQEAAELYNHPLIRSMTRKRGRVRTWVGGRHRLMARFASGRYPSYLPSQAFVTALLDKTQRDAGPNADLESALEKLPNSQLKEILQTLYRDADGKVDRFRQRVEDWFDDAMERVSGWYRRRVQIILWLIAIVLVTVLNADSFQLARTLWTDDAVRDAVVVQAEEVVQRSDGPDGRTDDIATVADKIEKLPELAIPLGWTTKDGDPREVPGGWDWFLKLGGLLATAAALTFGAPFWFDLLRRVGGVRSIGRRPRAEQNDDETKSDE